MRSGKILVLAVTTTILIVSLALKLGLIPDLLRIRSPDTAAAGRPSSDQPAAARGGGNAPSASKGTVYVTLSPHCPISNAAIPKLNQLHDKYGDNGIEMIGVVPGAAATAMIVELHADDYDVRFPLVHDARHTLCQQLNATHTPQAFLIDKVGAVIYSGPVDDQFVRVAAGSRPPRQQFLREAVDRFLAGNNTCYQIAPIGCLIESVPNSGQHQMSTMSNSETTFSGGVASLIFDHCSRCHRAGEAAPFPLMTYEDVTRHALQIQDVVRRRQMPPWKPVANFGKFRDAHLLSDEEILQICSWVDAGMPRGRAEDMPDVPQFTAGWQLGKPDVELIMPESFAVPADGPDIYQHFIIPTGIAENRLVNAVEFRPGAAEVVHHAFVYFDTTGKGRELDAQQSGPGYSRVGTPGFIVSGSLGGWGPGGLPGKLPEGMGRPMDGNADLVVQIHYHPSGRAVSDRSRIGLHFADPSADRFVTEIMVADVDLEIPAAAERHHHHAEWTLPVDTWLLDATPHMHTLGRRIQATARLPNGTIVPLVRIDDWDFYWQDAYVYEEFVALPAGTVIELDCWFDNSAKNALNPNSPPKTVRWGDFSDDEMAICYFRVTTNNFADYVTLNKKSGEHFHAMWKQYQDESAAVRKRDQDVASGN